MPDMSKKQNKMPLLDPVIRSKCFDEVALGYDEKTAVAEADRCLDCPSSPCVSGCPVGIKIPDFIKLIREKKFEESYEEISKYSSLPAVCGRVCPQETQCEANCVRAKNGESVAIGRLERFVADRHNKNEKSAEKITSDTKGKVAIIGSGPAGLACAGELAKNGCFVTVFEALHKAGGVLVYGIPEFRLPKKIVERETDNLKKNGVEIVTDVVIGKTLTVSELFERGYNAVFIGSGAGLPMFMNIEGESLSGVYSANEFLTRSNLMKAYKDGSDTPIKKGGKFVVVGGGNVAMDAARTALRLDAEKVTIVYRRSFEEMPARKEEIEHAKEEGIEIKTLCNPVRIIGNEQGTVSAVRLIKTELKEPDERGRRRPVEIPDSEFEIEADTVIMALGSSPNPLIKNTTAGLEFTGRGIIKVNDKFETSLKGVYAGGDAVTGAATVISAMGAGKKAAQNILSYLSE